MLAAGLARVAGATLAAVLTTTALAGCRADDRAAGQEAGPGTADGAGAVALGRVDSLPSPAAPGSGEPNLAVGPDGHVVLSWLEPTADGGHALRFASIGPDDSHWSAPRTVVARDDLFVNWADFPSVLPLGGGRLAAHWLQRAATSGAYDVHLVRSTDGGLTWSADVVPHHDGTATEHGFVSLWPAGGDTVAAVWLDGRKYAGTGGHDAAHGAAGAETQLAYTILAPDGTAAPERMVDVRTCDCCQTSAALTARGPLVVYRDRSAQEVRDIAAVRLVDGRWTEPAPVHADGWTIEACPVNGPAVAAEGERAVTAWFTAARDTARVQVAFSTDAGATWTPPVRVDEGDPVGRVDVALLADGSAVVLWLARTGGEGAAVRMRHIAPDGTLDEPVTVAASAAARSSGFPQLARSGGWLHLAWTEPGTPSRLRLARVSLQGDAP
ncbi:MAG TPA: sialidase family protein [Gemmatimonadaceae bacterium]|nr:sialidase family protein [Gemmatimonadaceae bacterium]